ncbi:MAG: histidine kinase [Thermoanaerobaculia bacterium]
MSKAGFGRPEAGGSGTTPRAVEGGWRWRRVALWALFWLALGAFFSLRVFLSRWVGRETMAWWPALQIWTIHWLLWGALSPAIARLSRRLPIRGFAPGPIVTHLALAILFAVAELAAAAGLSWLLRISDPMYGPIFRYMPVEFANLFHYNVVTYALILGANLLAASARRTREQEVFAAQLAADLARAELAALRMQLHPHFLFNTLNDLAGLVHEDPRAAETTIVRLADLMRRALRTAERPDVPLAEELEFADGYFEIERMRLGGRFRVDYRVADDLLELPVPSLILQPLVENAVRHGVARTAGPAEIAIEACREGGVLRIVVENDCPTGGASTGGHGIGLANTKARLRSLFGGATTLEHGRIAPARYRVTMSLPLAPRAAGA